MLALPLIPPQDDNTTWMQTTYRPRPDSPPPLPSVTQNQQPNHRQRQQQDEEKRLHNARSPLATLAADELAIEQRKAAVRNFGSHWIRPPGVPKTLQAMNEEALEREEQAEIERQEAGLRDMQAQQQLAEAQQAAEQGEAQDEEEEMEERNLDDEIPDAETTTADVTFNEDSMMEGSQVDILQQETEQYAELEEAELTGAARDEEDLGMEMERDLDDSVPEAGSYQHTDTEIEDSESDSELMDSLASRSALRPARTPLTRGQMDLPPLMAGLQERMRAQVSVADSLTRSSGSLNLSSSILDSSLVNSSPAMPRANAAGRGRGGRQQRSRHS